jgi:3-deoxy-7-phosphoheptulonate synthase
MIVVMESNASSEEVQRVQDRLVAKGFSIHLSQGVERTIIGAVGGRGSVNLEFVEALPGVEKVVPILKPFKLTSREFQAQDTVIRIGNQKIGDGSMQIIAGPCAVESREQYLEIAQIVKDAGATMLRGGAFKPRTSPYAFQGLEEEGLKILAEARDRTGLPIITEVVDPRLVSLVAEYADVLQVGARNMQNFFLLKEVGKVNKPVIIKRGPSATIEEWIMAAEYVLSSGNPQVIFCERGIRTFETYTRNTLDLSAVPLLKQLTHLPVLVDPSHGTGKWRLVEPMARAAMVVGADGIMVEVHQNPEEALSDGPQSLNPENFRKMVQGLDRLILACS